MSQKPSKILVATSGAARKLRDNPGLVVVVVGVGVLGVAVGRLSSSGAAAPAPSAPSASIAPEPSAEGQHFDLTEDPRSKAGVPLRPMDRDIFDEIIALKLDRERMRDVFPDRPYRVSFVGSIAEHRVGLVMIDMNRDGKFDERWDLKRDGVTRMVMADAAAGGEPVKYTLAHGRWQVH